MKNNQLKSIDIKKLENMYLQIVYFMAILDYLVKA